MIGLGIYYADYCIYLDFNRKLAEIRIENVNKMWNVQQINHKSDNNVAEL